MFVGHDRDTHRHYATFEACGDTSFDLALRKANCASPRGPVPRHLLLAIFEASGEGEGLSSYVDTHRLFARGEMMSLCKGALASGPKTTKELALHVMAAKRAW